MTAITLSLQSALTRNKHKAGTQINVGSRGQFPLLWSDSKDGEATFLPAIVSDRVRMTSKPESAGINRHVVGDARALQERSSESILTSSLAGVIAR